MKLTLGFSPCPNDTFIFEAMVHGRVDTEGLEFDWFLADVEELNRRAVEGSVDITKMSFHAYARTAQKYLILDSGSALGRSNGPLVVSRRPVMPDELDDALIAIPGKYTTANLLFSIFWPGATRKREYLFSDIPGAVLSGEADAGLIIHETRFTFRSMGLTMVADTGAMWEKMTGLPVPLGGIVISRNIDPLVASKVERAIRRSIEYARSSPRESVDFIRQHARETDAEVTREHIKLYVNDFSLSLGEEGRRAIEKLFSVALEKGVANPLPASIFLK
ncbi:MAG TPA: 1,4-dihydroxy-6-naphthoate synthase [Bacteroidales bacterium]|jgi:1,4-dihydroxy-6-naphthoate synthase|nr:1,4-dihydroxy-6-naphthoate synthase [Bacteroidales bacterium]HOC47231.1 1,4-dihydroxy-6-naphthoate synthase [Bacteroidales bacterium]HOH14347.1 1,4-dihydroxy-6-naphthoate synthase [Bacteroidales bacterium]HPX52734.1 1,4-dihydroxy-6-naphthoate synthase [Bacteroidales bacterium]HQB51355.1 1,4-dihydroxy-6-naphthoate synthase [Bacteroidales bacterium]